MSSENAIELDQFIARPPAEVWRALTDPDLHAQWWAPGDVRAEVGHRFTLDMGPWGRQQCEVLEAEPGRRLVYAFVGEGLDTTLTWVLEPEGSGTRLFLVHAGFDPSTEAGRTGRDGMGRGWPALLRRIERIPVG